MSAPTGKMMVSLEDKAACVKITGRATFASSVDLKTLFTELRQREFGCFVLDLSECTLMDSTFLGVLAGFGLKMNDLKAGDAGRALELFNPSSRIIELLENLGVLHLFKVTQGERALPGKTELTHLAPANPTREEVTRTCLEAHELLMQINPQNVARFKDVAQFLAEDLKNLKPAP